MVVPKDHFAVSFAALALQTTKTVEVVTLDDTDSSAVAIDVSNASVATVIDAADVQRVTCTASSRACATPINVSFAPPTNDAIEGTATCPGPGPATSFTLTASATSAEPCGCVALERVVLSSEGGRRLSEGDTNTTVTVAITPLDASAPSAPPLVD